MGFWQFTLCMYLGSCILSYFCCCVVCIIIVYILSIYVAHICMYIFICLWTYNYYDYIPNKLTIGGGEWGQVLPYTFIIIYHPKVCNHNAIQYLSYKFFSFFFFFVLLSVILLLSLILKHTFVLLRTLAPKSMKQISRSMSCKLSKWTYIPLQPISNQLFSLH